MPEADRPGTSQIDVLSKQGGFAKCYKFTREGTNKVLAGKVVDKDSLNKNKAKQKVGKWGGELLYVHGGLRYRELFERSFRVLILMN